MPNWNREYFRELCDRFDDLTSDLPERIEQIGDGRIAPAVDDIAIGSGRKIRAAVLFFDIRSFSSRTDSGELPGIKRAVYMLDAVVPTIMRIVFDNDGYVEKNTGDGIMAIFPVDGDDSTAANAALDTAVTSFYAIKNVINPHLSTKGIDPIEARIGIDIGTLILARIGTATGAATHDRNFLTAVGASANLACKLQQRAGTNEIWVGDLIKTNAYASRQQFFVDVTPHDWTWRYVGTTNSYRVWHYNAVRTDPQ